MEKPLTSDGPTSRRMIALAKEASAKNLKCAVGLMSRHARHLQELQKRIQDGEIGDVVMMRGYRMAGRRAGLRLLPKKYPGYPNNLPGNPTELLWQISRFHSFIWASGGCFNDFYIHHVDHLSWMKNAWPVKAQALGGRHYRNSPEGQHVTWTRISTRTPWNTLSRTAQKCTWTAAAFGRLQRHLLQLRPRQPGHGRRRAKDGDCGAPSSIYTGLKADRDKRTWISKEPPGESATPTANEALGHDLADGHPRRPALQRSPARR